MQPQGLTARDPSPADALTGDGGGHWTQPMLERELYLLGRVAEIGVAILEAMQRQVTAAEPRVRSSVEGPVLSPAEGAAEPAPQGAEPEATQPDPVPPLFQGDIALAYARVSRAVRMTVALQAHLIEEIKDAEQAQVRNAKLFAEANAAADNLRRKDRKGVVARVLTDIIHDRIYPDGVDGPEPPDKFTVVFPPGKPEREAYERLVREASERLFERDRYGDVLARPISEFIDLVCRDLGLRPDWRQLAEEDWAREEMRSGKVGRPLEIPLYFQNLVHPDDLRREGARRPTGSSGFLSSRAVRAGPFGANDCAKNARPPAVGGRRPSAPPAPA